MSAKEIQDRLRQVTFTSGLEAICASHTRYREEIVNAPVCDEQGNAQTDKETGESLHHEVDEDFLLDSLLYDQLPRQFFPGHEQLFVVRTMAIADSWSYEKVMDALQNIHEDAIAIKAMRDASRQERGAARARGAAKKRGSVSAASSSAISERRERESGPADGRGRPPPNSCANCHEVGHVSRHCPHPYCFDCRISFPTPERRYLHSQDVHSSRPPHASNSFAFRGGYEDDRPRMIPGYRADDLDRRDRPLKRGRSRSRSPPPRYLPPPMADFYHDPRDRAFSDRPIGRGSSRDRFRDREIDRERELPPPLPVRSAAARRPSFGSTGSGEH